MRKALANFVLGLSFIGDAAWGQDAVRATAHPATVEVVGDGVFALPQGSSVFVEKFNNRILLAFPIKTGKASKNAYWPGPVDKREPCTDLATDEYELVLSGEPVCVRMGWTIDTLRSIGDGILARHYNGGCVIDIVRFEKQADVLNLIARTDCTEVVPFNK